MLKLRSCYASDALLKLKMHQNSLSVGAPLGAYTTLPRSPSRLEEGNGVGYQNELSY